MKSRRVNQTLDNGYSLLTEGVDLLLIYVIWYLLDVTAEYVLEHPVDFLNRYLCDPLKIGRDSTRLKSASCWCCLRTCRAWLRERRAA